MPSAPVCLLLEWYDAGWQEDIAAIIGTCRARGVDAPIFVLVKSRFFQDIPTQVLE